MVGLEEIPAPYGYEITEAAIISSGPASSRA
jgi:hypothetical protein